MCTKPIRIENKDGEIYWVKCGKCDTCRRERASHWAIKLINEAKYHKKACFITLTFDNKILREGNKYGANCSFLFHIENSKVYFQKFMKRLRKKFNDKMITFYHVAEYGEKTKRPHHHAIIFGINFEEDRIEIEKSKTNHTQYTSKTLLDLWNCGRVSIQDINPANINYISQYAIKKYKKMNDRYKEKQSFSNRSKMSIRWVRRNPEQIIKGYIEDSEGHKYCVPTSYKENLKNSEEEKYKECYRQYEEKILDRIQNTTKDEMIKQQKIKEEIVRRRNNNFNKFRDF